MKIKNLNKFFKSLETMPISERPTQVIYRNSLLRVDYKDGKDVIIVNGVLIKHLIDQSEGMLCNGFGTVVKNLLGE